MSPTAEGAHVAFYIRNLDMGGIQRMILTLANGLAERDYTVDLVLANGKGELLGEVAGTVQIHNLAARRAFTSLPGFVRYARRHQPDVVVSASDSINLLLPWVKVLGLVDARIVVSVHNNMSQYAQNEGIWYSGALPFLIDQTYVWADKIITVSKGIAHDLWEKSRELRGKTTVVYNPVVDPSLREKAEAPVDHPWLANSNQPVVLGVGRLTPQKNFPLLLRAFANVREDVSAKLILLGDGPDRGSLETLTDKLGLNEHVDFMGFVSNPYAYFSRASLYTLSSVYEGLPTVLIEALACGCPVVSTDCPSGPHEILEGGKWGRLVPVNDVEALAEAMRATLADPPDPERLRKRADAFSVEAAVDAYEKVLFPRSSSGSSSRASVSA